MWLGNQKCNLPRFLIIFTMKRLCNNKEPRSFFIMKAVNFFNERPYICVASSFFGVISKSAKIVDLYDFACYYYYFFSIRFSFADADDSQNIQIFICNFACEMAIAHF